MNDSHGQIIKESRHRMGLSQRALAEKMQVQYATLARWETGKHEPSPLGWRRFTEVMKEMEAPTAEFEPTPVEVEIDPEPLDIPPKSTRAVTLVPKPTSELQLRREQLRAVKERAKQRRLGRERR